MKKKLKEIKDILPQLFAEVQQGNITLCEAGLFALVFEDMAESLRNGIKSRMLDKNISAEQDDNVTMTVKERYKYDYSKIDGYTEIMFDAIDIKEKMKTFEEENINNPNIEVQISSVLTIKAI